MIVHVESSKSKVKNKSGHVMKTHQAFMTLTFEKNKFNSGTSKRPTQYYETL